MTPSAPATWSNWAGNVHARPVGVEHPASIAELQDVVRRARADGRRVKAVGSGHSFTPIAVTDGVQVQLDRLTGIRAVDTATGQVTAGAGIGLHELNRALWSLGLSMTNLGDIDVQTLAGALATGTHGTGAKLGGIATQVRALTLVTADGAVLTCTPEQHPDVFAAAAVGLGALGIVAEVTLQCEPAFALAAAEAPGTLDAVLAGLEQEWTGHDHFEFYWFPHTRRVLTKRNDRVRPGTQLRPLGRVRGYIDDELLSNTVFEGLNRLTVRRPGVIPRLNQVSARVLSARDYIDRSYRVFASSRRVRFREMEYALPRAAVPSVLAELAGWIERSGEQIAFPVEVRCAAADELWLSTAHGRETGYVAVHQYWRRDSTRYFRAFEQIARAHDGRPHWGKLHERTAEDLAPAYPRFADFLAVRDRLDPDRLFGNDYLTRVLGS